MNSPKRRQYKYAKSRYRVKNWGEYEAGLRRRGDLTVWLSDEALDAWRAPPSGKPGGQRRYADIAIEAALTIRTVAGEIRAGRVMQQRLAVMATTGKAKMVTTVIQTQGGLLRIDVGNHAVESGPSACSVPHG